MYLLNATQQFSYRNSESCTIKTNKTSKFDLLTTQRALNINKTTLKKCILQMTEPWGGGRLVSWRENGTQTNLV